ncbi:hypothetical protein ACFQ6U_02490 [Streptomyces sp. NPDC056465]|uniref:hypothetical protein n=1 Tax=unclassified Streptomyces TaxID=2593676 RepID=UPI0035DA5D0A
MAHEDMHRHEEGKPSQGRPVPESLPGSSYEAVHVDHRRLTALEAQVTWQGNELRKLMGSRGRLGRLSNVDADQLQVMAGRIAALEQWVRQLCSDVERSGNELRERLADMDRLLDGVRGSRVQDAISSGELTSDLHRRHLLNAEAYRTLIAQNLRRFAVRLCPVGSVQDAEMLASARARAVAELLQILFGGAPSGLPATAEELHSELVARGRPTSREEAGPELDKIVERAKVIARELAGDTLPAVLVGFGTDARTLPPSAYEPYNIGATGVPGFLVAPAYVIDGDQQDELLRPLVFIVPAGAAETALDVADAVAAKRPDSADRVA